MILKVYKYWCHKYGSYFEAESSHNPERIKLVAAAENIKGKVICMQIFVSNFNIELFLYLLTCVMPITHFFYILLSFFNKRLHYINKFFRQIIQTREKFANVQKARRNIC